MNQRQLAIYMMVGLPASGKTVWAKQIVKDTGAKRISKDDIRAMMDFGEYSPQSEVFVLAARDALIIKLLQRGCDVVIDDTNINPRHRKRLEIIAEYTGAELKVIEMRTALETCLERDACRGDKSVGRDAIMSMHKIWEMTKCSQEVTARWIACDEQLPERGATYFVLKVGYEAGVESYNEVRKTWSGSGRVRFWREIDYPSEVTK